MTREYDAPQDRVSQLYQQGADELPSEQVDKAVLAKAKAASQYKQGRRPGGAHWRRFAWPLSVAASAMFVAVVFVVNVPYPESTVWEQVATYEEELAFADDAPIKPIPRSNPEVAPVAVTGRQKMNVLEMDEVAEKVVQQAAQAPDSVSLQKRTSEQILDSTASAFMGASEVTMDSFVELDTELLDHLTAQLGQSTAMADPGTDLSDTAVRAQIFEVLQRYRVAHPDRPLPEKYLAVLDKQQLLELTHLAPDQAVSAQQDEP